jgi:prophage antirepressor-like protein
MKELQTFTFKESGIQLASILRNNEPWFFAFMLSEPLGYKFPRDMVRKLDSEDKEVITGEKFSKLVCALKPHARMSKDARSLTLISEFGLYDAILSSNMPNAKKFKRWITHEVLPSIRKTGSYSVENPIEYTMKDKMQIAVQSKKMAKAFGFKGNQAIIAADRVTKRSTGFSPVLELGLKLERKQDNVFTMTAISKRLDSPLTTNKCHILLMNNGYLNNVDGVWEPSKKCKSKWYEKSDVEVTGKSSITISLKWTLKIVKVLNKLNK